MFYYSKKHNSCSIFCNFMASLELTVQVLRCFTPTRSVLSVSEAANLLSLPKSTLSRLLRDMAQVGFLEVQALPRGYRLGSVLHEIGETARQSQTLISRASAAVRRLSDRLGHTGYVSALVGTDMVGLVHHIGHNPIQVGVPLGGRLAVDACATGRAWLASLSDKAVRDMLKGRVSKASAQSPRTFAELLERLAQVRADGFAESTHEAGKDVGALAVAVEDIYTGQRLSLCVTFAIPTISPAERAQAIALMLEEKNNLMRIPA